MRPGRAWPYQLELNLENGMLDANLKAQLKAYLTRLQRPIELVASLDDRAASREMRELLEEIVTLSDKIALRLDGDDARRPSFSIGAVGQQSGLRFAAIPMGHEFTSLVLALLQSGGHPPKLDDDTIEQIKALGADDGSEFVFETYMSLTCHNCPDVVQALNLMAVLNPRVRHVAIDGALNQDEVESRQIMAVPTVFLNGKPFASGRMEIGEISPRSIRKVARDAVTSGHARTLRRIDRGRRTGRRGGRRVRRAQRHPHRPGGRAAGRTDARYDGHRELHLGARDAGAEVRCRAGSACARLRGRPHERPARCRARAVGRAGREKVAGERRRAGGRP
jgi:hypothetical protein